MRDPAVERWASRVCVCVVCPHSSVISSAPTHLRLLTCEQTHFSHTPPTLFALKMEKMHPVDAVCPAQRWKVVLCRLQNILKRTKEGTKEEETASKALASVSKVNATTRPHNLTVKGLWKFDVSHCLGEGFPSE